MMGCLGFIFLILTTGDFIEKFFYDRPDGLDDLPDWILKEWNNRSELREKKDELITLLPEHSKPIKTIAISNDSKFIASAGVDNDIAVSGMFKMKAYQTLSKSMKKSQWDLHIKRNNGYLLFTGW